MMIARLFLVFLTLLFVSSCKKAENAGAKRTLHLFAMSDYFPPKFLKDFEAKYKCEIRYDYFSNNEELLAKFQAGATGYDVIVPSDYIVTALISGGFLTPLDHSKISNLKNLAPEFSQAPYDPAHKHTVTFTWGTSGLAYNTKKLTETVDSWNALFSKNAKGHVSLLDDPREVIGAMLKIGGKSLNTTAAADLVAAKKLLTSLKPSVRLFTSDPKQHLLSGDVWLAHIYSGDAQQVMKSNPEIRYVVPKEGGVVWVDNLAVPKGAKDAELAHAFINELLDPSVAQLFAHELRYGSPNQAAESLIQDASLRASAYRAIKPGLLEFIKDLGDQSAQWDQIWTELKSM